MLLTLSIITALADEPLKTRIDPRFRPSPPTTTVSSEQAPLEPDPITHPF
ncbi:MAG: hypothetical protein ACI8S6_000080 [Myxococcota bacterium]|jgi:hypothetical protein